MNIGTKAKFVKWGDMNVEGCKRCGVFIGMSGTIEEGKDVNHLGFLPDNLEVQTALRAWLGRPWLNVFTINLESIENLDFKPFIPFRQ